MSAFYKLLVNSYLEQLKELYRREIKSNSKDFVYQTEHEAKVFEAVKTKDRRKIVRSVEYEENQVFRVTGQKRTVLSKAAKQFAEAAEMSKDTRLKQVDSKGQTIVVDYSRIIRTIVFLQRKFRYRKLRLYFEEIGKLNDPEA